MSKRQLLLQEKYGIISHPGFWNIQKNTGFQVKSRPHSLKKVTMKVYVKCMEDFICQGKRQSFTQRAGSHWNPEIQVNRWKALDAAM